MSFILCALLFGSTAELDAVRNFRAVGLKAEKDLSANSYEFESFLDRRYDSDFGRLIMAAESSKMESERQLFLEALKTSNAITGSLPTAFIFAFEFFERNDPDFLKSLEEPLSKLASGFGKAWESYRNYAREALKAAKAAAAAAAAGGGSSETPIMPETSLDVVMGSEDAPAAAVAAPSHAAATGDDSSSGTSATSTTP